MLCNPYITIPMVDSLSLSLAGFLIRFPKSTCWISGTGAVTDLVLSDAHRGFPKASYFHTRKALIESWEHSLIKLHCRIAAGFLLPCMSETTPTSHSAPQFRVKPPEGALE